MNIVSSRYRRQAVVMPPTLPALDVKPPYTVLMLHECAFARLGVQTLLAPGCRVEGAGRLEPVVDLLPALASVDLLLVSARCVPYSSREALACFMRVLYDAHPRCQVLLLMTAAEAAHFCFMTGVFLQVGAIDMTLPVPALALQLSGVLQGAELPALPFAWQVLSKREYAVLDALMSGMLPWQIGKALKLSEKTISHYKRHGLKKLGMRNMQTLLLSTFSRRVFEGAAVSGESPGVIAKGVAAQGKVAYRKRDRRPAGEAGLYLSIEESYT
jgi:DNA-binding CsgD family transcriptional regulator